MHDRTTKLLLSLIAVALWALLLRPAVTPAPAHAQAVHPLDTSPMARFASPVVKMHDGTRRLYVIDNAGWVFRLDPDSLAIQANVRLMPKQ